MTIIIERPSALSAAPHTVFTRGTGPLSDGYTYGVTGGLITILTRQHSESQFGTQYYSKLVASIALAGTVFRMLFFEWVAYEKCVKFRVVLAAIFVIGFSLVSGGLIGAGFDIGVTVIWTCCIRFLLGMTTCAEHPCGLFCTPEQAEEDRIAKNVHRWRVVLGTNTMIGMGFVVAAFVPLVPYRTHGENFGTIWNGSLALGAVPAFFLLLFSAKELDYCWCKHSVPAVRIPFRIALRRYWKNLLGLSLAWFIYDFITYPLGIYASTITNSVTGVNSSLSIVFGWSVVINLFYIPGAVAGTVLIDVVSPKTVMIIGLLLQAAMGFIMGAVLSPLTSHVALFAVPYGIFLSLGPGSCLRVLAAKIGPTAICRQYGGMAVAIGKVGAFIGMWVIPHIIDAFGGLKTAKGITGPFWTYGGLAVLSALVTTFLVKPLTHDGAKVEDKAFRQYLEENGFDANLLDVPINTPNSRNTQMRINVSSAA